MARMTCRLACVVGVMVCAHGLAQAATPEGEARSAISLLLKASSMPVDQATSCHGTIPGIDRPSLGDLVASRLVALDGGKNAITARCEQPSLCRVTIAHADGEDVSSAEFRFRIADGRLAPASLTCVLTP